MPIIGSFTRRRLSASNVNFNFNMKKSAVNEIMPSIDTNGGDLSIVHPLDSPEFKKSLFNNQSYFYWAFGAIITLTIVLLYLLKICWVVPQTKDAGEVISHILLMKVPAMVIYPSFGGFIDYCYGFSLIDFPFLNNFFSLALTNQSDQSPPSFKMFYNNLSIASTYLLALLAFSVFMVPSIAYIFISKYF